MSISSIDTFCTTKNDFFFDFLTEYLITNVLLSLQIWWFCRNLIKSFLGHRRCITCSNDIPVHFYLWWNTLDRKTQVNAFSSRNVAESQGSLGKFFVFDFWEKSGCDLFILANSIQSWPFTLLNNQFCKASVVYCLC